MQIEFNSIKDLLGKNYILKGNDYKSFLNIKPVSEANERDLTWISPLRKDGYELLSKTKSQLIICDSNLKIDDHLNEKCFLIVENPKVVFTRILRTF